MYGGSQHSPGTSHRAFHSNAGGHGGLPLQPSLTLKFSPRLSFSYTINIASPKEKKRYRSRTASA